MAKQNNNQQTTTDNTLLYDLDWLKKGEVFPPRSQTKRLEKYDTNRKLFESEQADVFKNALSRIQRIVGDLRGVILDPVILNYNKLLSIKTADLVCGEEPRVTYGDDSKVLDDMKKNIKFSKLLYETTIDISRYGDAIWRLYKNESSKGDITIWEPGEWFPIVNPEDKKKITNHVLAWMVYKGELQNESVFHLYVQIHYKGYYEKLIYKMKGKKIIGERIEKETIKTGFDDFAVVHSSNVTTSDSIFGHDDYKPINSIISELMVRFGQIQKILDKHSSPSVQGSIESLTKNQLTGKWEFKMANFFARTPGEEPASYLTWDGNLESAFKEIEKLIDQLLVISEMGTALLGGIDSAGRATSGTTMKLRMVNPLMKSKRIVDSLHDNLLTTIVALSTMGYTKLDKDKLTIEWFDGLPDDPKEEADIMSVRTGSKPTISQKRAIMLLNDMDEAQAEKELEEIKNTEPTFDEPQPMDQFNLGSDDGSDE